MSIEIFQPWVVNPNVQGPNSSGTYSIDINNGAGSSAISVWLDNKLPSYSERYTSKLIAAAPDLLTACQEMFKHIRETDFDVCGTSDEQIDRWKTAIAKAIT